MWADANPKEHPGPGLPVPFLATGSGHCPTRGWPGRWSSRHSRTRTGDTPLFRRVLYQLSYMALFAVTTELKHCFRRLLLAITRRQ